MLPRRRFHPDGHLSIGVPLNHSHGLRCGELLFIGGQADIDGQARVTCPNDFAAQAGIAMDGILEVLQGLGDEPGDLVKLTAFYVLDTSPDESQILDILAAKLPPLQGPGPAITLVPIETNCFTGLSIEIEGIAMRGHNGETLARSASWIADGAVLPASFSQALRCGEMIFTSGQSAGDQAGILVQPGSLVGQSHVVLDKLARLLAGLGADLGDAVKANVFNVEPGDKEDWKAGALARASHYPDPGPVATGISLPRMQREGMMIRYDVIAMRGRDGQRLHRQTAWPEGHWDWPVHMPYRHGLRVGDLVFIGGQVSLAEDSSVLDPGDIEAQTRTAMDNIGRVLAEFGLDYRHLVKVNTFYAGSKGEADLLQNARVRCDYYRDPGPVSTGIPFSWLAYPDMLIEIDCIAMV